MEWVDFSECEFINEEMKIYTYYDFCDNRRAIKRLYRELTDNGRRFYMWYIYSNTHMNNHFKNTIWDYLNDFIDDVEVLYRKRLYKVR